MQYTKPKRSFPKSTNNNWEKIDITEKITYYITIGHGELVCIKLEAVS